MRILHIFRLRLRSLFRGGAVEAELHEDFKITLSVRLRRVSLATSRPLRRGLRRCESCAACPFLRENTVTHGEVRLLANSDGRSRERFYVLFDCRHKHYRGRK